MPYLRDGTWESDPAWQQCDDLGEYYEDLDEEDTPSDDFSDELERVIEDRTDIGDALLDMQRREDTFDTRLQAEALWGDERRKYRQPY